jgi:hypothetical protein
MTCLCQIDWCNLPLLARFKLAPKLSAVDDDNAAKVELLFEAPNDLVLLRWCDSDENFRVQLARVALISIWRRVRQDCVRIKRFSDSLYLLDREESRRRYRCERGSIKPNRTAMERDSWAFYSG